MRKLFLAFITLYLSVNGCLYSQVKIDTAQLIEQYKSFFTKMSDKDARAFVYSRHSKEPYALSEDSKEKKEVPKGTITKYH